MLLLLSPSLGWATTILGIRTPEAVVIAADSEQTMKGGTQAQSRRTGTKIFEESGTVYAIGGMAMIRGEVLIPH